MSKRIDVGAAPELCPACDGPAELVTRNYYTARGIALAYTHCRRCWSDIDEADRIMGTGDPMERAR